MNIAKNMEAIFLAAATLAGATLVTTAVAATPAAKNIAATTQVAQAAAGKMQVVVITAKRLSAAEKAALAN
jgi:hypothetical protein